MYKNIQMYKNDCKHSGDTFTNHSNIATHGQHHKIQISTGSGKPQNQYILENQKIFDHIDNDNALKQRDKCSSYSCFSP